MHWWLGYLNQSSEMHTLAYVFLMNDYKSGAYTQYKKEV